MAYFVDLSPYTYGMTDVDSRALNIGWLENGHPVGTGTASADVDSRAVNIGWLENGYAFDTGTVPEGVLSRLEKLAENPKNLMMGYHTCDLCDGRWQGQDGNGEIHVTGTDGITYIAPVLVVHYIKQHKYLPPQQFINAGLASNS